jgi:two-component system sensor histidine kinase HydH
MPPRPGRGGINLNSKRALQTAAVYIGIGVISVLHYLTPPHLHSYHDIYRRLYYLPIIFAAFLGGLRGGVIASAVVCLVYAPHAFGHVGHDPASPTQKVLEMVLYLAVGVTTGWLMSRLQRAQRQLQSTTDELRGSLEQLRRTEEQLVHSARLAAVGRLSAGLAHEIRNPLASIKGSAEILADDYPGGHPKHRLLQVLVEEAVRLNEVLSRFLAFARPRPIEKLEIALGEEVDAVITLLEGRHDAGAARFVVERRDGTPGRVLGDREQLRQVLLNVLLNARQAAGEDGSVRIECSTSSGAVRVRIHDSGPGFSQEALENAFTPFYTTKEQGTGLGLAISHRIIESHGGSIRAFNGEHGGGVVELTLPAVPALPDAISEERAVHGQDPLR